MAALKNIEQLFVEWGGLIRNNVAKNIVTSDFYLKYLPKDKWVDGQGTQISYPIYERSLSSAATSTPGGVTFESWTSSGGDGRNDTKAPGATYTPDPTTSNLVSPAGSGPKPRGGVDGGGSYIAGQNIDSFGVTVRTMQLKKAALNSPDICLDDLQFAWQVEDQVKNVVRVLSENTKYVWTNTYQDEYVNACGQKSVAIAPYDPTTTSFAATPATSKLTWGILEAIYEQLGYEGGSINPFARVDEMTPIYAAVGERYTFSDLKRQDDNVRDDFRYAYMGNGDSNPMLAAPGLNAIYRGFKFFTVELPPRYTFDPALGAWQRVYPYEPRATSRGMKWEISSAYKNAPYTDTVIYHQDVMKILTPNPRTSKGGGMTYNPAFSWAGEFVWRNIPDRESNIDGSTGFFRALYAYGAKVERPELGFVVRHLRCVDRAGCLTDCAGDPVCPTP
jgi:hypothetical protein